jgi:hypothetical protein
MLRFPESPLDIGHQSLYYIQRVCGWILYSCILNNLELQVIASSQKQRISHMQLLAACVPNETTGRDGLLLIPNSLNVCCLCSYLDCRLGLLLGQGI